MQLFQKFDSDFDRIFNEELAKIGKEPVTKKDLKEAFSKKADDIVKADKSLQQVPGME